MDFAHSFGQVGMDCELQTSSSKECTVRVHGCGVSRETPRHRERSQQVPIIPVATTVNLEA